MRYITLQFIPVPILRRIYSKNQADQCFIRKPGIIITWIFLHLRVEQEF